MSTDVSATISPCNSADMIKSNLRLPDFVLDGIHFGRGDYYVSNYSKEIHRYKSIEIKCWEVNGNSLAIVKPELAGHFYACCNYLVYVKYEAKVYDLTNEEHIKENLTYDLCFYWRGATGPQSAPFPEELEDLNPPVQRIIQWSELPIFVRLFHGTLMVHIDKMPKEVFLYILRGTIKEEAHFIEVPAEKRSLRSRTSFLLIVPKRGEIFVWHGRKSDKHNTVLIRNVLEQLKKTKLTIYGVSDCGDVKILKLNEGNENDEFLESLMGQKSDYYSLLHEPSLYNYTARLFYFNSIIGTFLATEVEDTLASENNNPFPFLQNHLYSAKQPGISIDRFFMD